MKATRLSLCLAALCLFSFRAEAQTDSVPLFNTLRLEMRADADFAHQMKVIDGTVFSEKNNYGFTGRYFNLHLGGNLNKQISYYFRQRIIANEGSSKFFDNTDFLYINYRFHRNWSVRAGKDALAVGGFEYDAPPIDVFFNAYYWDYFYCFQLAASVAYHTSDGRNTIMAQVGNSPYVHYGSTFQNSLLSYNLFWSGRYDHFQTLYSINMFQRDREGHFMNYIALGNKVTYPRWSLYVDLIHHANSIQQLLKNFGVIARADVMLGKGVSLFVKGGYEQNQDRDEHAAYRETQQAWDCLSVPGQTYCFGGVGCEYRPETCPDLRLHAYVADFCTRNAFDGSIQDLMPDENRHKIAASIGISCNFNFLKYINKKVK